MAKRLTDTDIWNDPWYRKLLPEGKILWKFLVDRCDMAGFWKKDFEMASFQCGFDVNDSLVKLLNDGKDRILDHGDYLEIADFVHFQYGELNDNCKPHRSVINLLDSYAFKGYRKGIERAKDKDKNKDKDKEGGVGDLTPADEVRIFFEGGDLFEDYLKFFAEKFSADPEYIKQEFQKFTLYWTEPSKSGAKQRWEQQPTFEVKRRLFTWLQRAGTYKGITSKPREVVI